MNYLSARIQSEATEKLYRNYIADCLYYQGQNKYPAYKFSDALEEMKKPVDRRSGEEILEDVIAKIGIEVTDNKSV